MPTPTQNKKAEENYLRLLDQALAQNTLNPFESEADKQARIKRALGDFNFFCRTYFPHLCPYDCAPFHIEAANYIKAHKHCRELKAMGRGLAKSMTYTTLLPLWLWANGELKMMLCVSINNDKAAELMQPMRAELEGNALLINDFGAQHNAGAWADDHFVTKNDCAFFALGAGQSPRGVRHRQYRVDYLVFDDCDTKPVSRNPKRLQQFVNWCLEDALGTCSPRGSRVVFVNNIFAKDTILTTLRDKRNDKGKWRFTQVNATDNEGNPTWDYEGAKAYYQLQRETMGILSFESEYNNRPYSEGSVFTDEMIRWRPLPPLKSFTRIIAHWDVAYSDSSKADYNAVRVWGLHGGLFYLIDCFVKQAKMTEAIKWCYGFQEQMLAQNIRCAFYYEAQFWDDALKMTMEQTAQQFPTINLRFIKNDRPKQHKYDRILEMHPLFQEGKIIYNKEKEANEYFLEGLEQLKGIEPGYKSHDDAPDSDAAAITLLMPYNKKQQKSYKVVRKPNRKH